MLGSTEKATCRDIATGTALIAIHHLRETTKSKKEKKSTQSIHEPLNQQQQPALPKVHSSCDE